MNYPCYYWLEKHDLVEGLKKTKTCFELEQKYNTNSIDFINVFLIKYYECYMVTQELNEIISLTR